MTRTAQQAGDPGDANEPSGMGVLARLARWGAAHPWRTAPAVLARVKPMLAAVARLPHVNGVVSPFTDEDAGAVSRDGRTAFATVNFDERANDLPVSAIERVIATAKAARSPALEVELGGQAIA